jgi:hypothetical protein
VGIEPTASCLQSKRSTPELNALKGHLASFAELNALKGHLASFAELNALKGHLASKLNALFMRLLELNQCPFVFPFTNALPLS